jgi:hypothetical protein
MKQCLPTPSPSTTDLKPSTPEWVPADPGGARPETAEKLLIKVKAWFGSLHFERIRF